MKRVGLVIGLFVFSILCFLVAVIPVHNNKIAEDVAIEIQNIPLPKQTKQIESISRAGKLVGNGNGMQYFGAMLIQSELTFEELEEHYSDYRKNEWTLIIEPQVGSEIKIIEHEHLKFQTEPPTSNYYIIYSWGTSQGLFHELDIRAH